MSVVCVWVGEDCDGRRGCVMFRCFDWGEADGRGVSGGVSLQGVGHVCLNLNIQQNFP